jgi:putative iron-regulated protein
MNCRFRTLAYAPLSLFAAFALGCSEDKAEGGLPANAAEVVANYADIVHASYEDSVEAAQDLEDSVATLVETPSAANLTAAQAAWRASREPYLQTEVYRFYEGPIDNEEDGPEGLLNAWPLDEQHIDYTVEEPTGGIVNDTSKTIDPETLEEENEKEGDKNIATGYHAVEFLLWGQDLEEPSAAVPGQRPFTDYVTDGTGTQANQDRRGDYINTASQMIVEHLEGLVEAWDPDGSNNYRADFVAAPPAESIGKILSGMVILSGFETGGERVEAALLAKDQEEEHSCFSDNTHRDMIQDVQGVQNVWLGSYRRINGSRVSGPSLEELVAAKDPALADDITEQIEETLEVANAMEIPFDREISEGNTAGNARVDALSKALFAQQELIDRVFELYGLSRIPDPE